MKRLNQCSIRSHTGFTLVEMLVTLGLLSVLVLISVSWMTSIITRQDQSQSRARWQRASVMLLEQIQRDLMQVDVLDFERRRDEPRVWIEREMLYIRTLDSGRPTTIQYALDPISKQVTRDTLGISNYQDSIPPLIGDVVRLTVELQVPDRQRVRPQVQVLIESSDGQSQAGVFTIELEDVRR